MRRDVLSGVKLIQRTRHADDRGSFLRVYDSDFSLEQTCLSFNRHKGTLRGMHLQKAPFAEAKTVYCTRGRLFDAVVDLRPDSPTYCDWFAVELSADDAQVLLVPQGCAHGFLTLEPNTEILYHISERYAPECEMGFAWNDPTFAIEWPSEPQVISERDQNHSPYHTCASC